MEEKLGLIKSLENEVLELDCDRKKAKMELDSCLIKIQDALSEIDEMKNIYRTNREDFRYESEQKITTLINPIFGTVSIMAGIVFGYIINRETGATIFNYVAGIGTSVFAFLMGSSLFVGTHDIYCNYQNKQQQKVTNKLRKYIFRKYSYIEEMYNDLTMLESDISVKKDRLKQLNIERKELENKCNSYCDLINQKKDEIFKLFEGYFEQFIDNNVVVEDNKEINSEVLGKRKIRVKVYEDK